MLLDLNFKIKTLSGKDIEEAEANKIIANMLSEGTKNSIKFYDWALKLWQEGKVEIDAADKKLLSDTITDSTKLTNLTKGQILKVIENLKEK